MCVSQFTKKIERFNFFLARRVIGENGTTGFSFCGIYIYKPWFIYDCSVQKQIQLKDIAIAVVNTVTVTSLMRIVDSLIIINTDHILILLLANV